MRVRRSGKAEVRRELNVNTYVIPCRGYRRSRGLDAIEKITNPELDNWRARGCPMWSLWVQDQQAMPLVLDPELGHEVLLESLVSRAELCCRLEPV
jgi:hypothetical protein